MRTSISIWAPFSTRTGVPTIARPASAKQPSNIPSINHGYTHCTQSLVACTYNRGMRYKTCCGAGQSIPPSKDSNHIVLLLHSFWHITLAVGKRTRFMWRWNGESRQLEWIILNRILHYKMIEIKTMSFMICRFDFDKIDEGQVCQW